MWTWAERCGCGDKHPPSVMHPKYSSFMWEPAEGVNPCFRTSNKAHFNHILCHHRWVLPATCQIVILPLSPCWLMGSSGTLQKWRWGPSMRVALGEHVLIWQSSQGNGMPLGFWQGSHSRRACGFIRTQEPTCGLLCWRFPWQKLGCRGLQTWEAYMAAGRV